MVILKAEAALAVAEAFTDNVAGGVLAPPLGVATGNRFRVGPTHALSLGVEESWPLVLLTSSPR